MQYFRARTLGDNARYEAGQDIAHPGRSHAGITPVDDVRQLANPTDQRTPALEQADAAETCADLRQRRNPVGLNFCDGQAEQPARLPWMRRQYPGIPPGRACRCEQIKGISINHQGLICGEHPLQ